MNFTCFFCYVLGPILLSAFAPILFPALLNIAGIGLDRMISVG